MTETISKLTSALTMHEKRKFPTQPEQNPKSQQHHKTSKVVEKYIMNPHETSKDSISENMEESVEPLTYE